MAHTTGGDGLPGFSGYESDEEKLDQCWDYFCEQLGDIEVRAFDGKLVRGFTEVSFEHIVSGSSNKWDTARGHDIGFVERRHRQGYTRRDKVAMLARLDAAGQEADHL